MASKSLKHFVGYATADGEIRHKTREDVNRESIERINAQIDNVLSDMEIMALVGVSMNNQEEPLEDRSALLELQQRIRAELVLQDATEQPFGLFRPEDCFFALRRLREKERDVLTLKLEKLNLFNRPEAPNPLPGQVAWVAPKPSESDLMDFPDFQECMNNVSAQMYEAEEKGKFRNYEIIFH